MRKKIMVLLICAVSLVSIPFSVIAAEKNVHTNVAVDYATVWKYQPNKW
mgnify:CR=1 FL=1